MCMSICVYAYVCTSMSVCWGSRARECEGLTDTRGQAWPAWEHQDARADWNMKKEISGTFDEQSIGRRGKQEVGSMVERPAVSWVTQGALHCSLVSFLCLPW